MLMYVNSTLDNDAAHAIKIIDTNDREYVITDLQKWTEYRVWMLAGTSVGDGVESDPIMVRTDEDGKQKFMKQNTKWKSMRCMPELFIM